MTLELPEEKSDTYTAQLFELIGSFYFNPQDVTTFIVSIKNENRPMVDAMISSYKKRLDEEVNYEKKGEIRKELALEIKMRVKGLGYE